MIAAPVKSRFITCDADEVRAIRGRRKTEIRRIVKPTVKGCKVGGYTTDGRSDIDPDDLTNVDKYGDPVDAPPFRCPYGVPGDEFWVQEAFLNTEPTHRIARHVRYAADYDAKELARSVSWRSPILMPRWASRLTLVVRSVRIERLSAITEDDAIAEGVDAFRAAIKGPPGFTGLPTLAFDYRGSYLAAFRRRWRIAFDADPWVWVGAFEVKA